MLVNIFLEPVVERPFLEVQVRVYHRPINIDEIMVRFILVKYVAFGVHFLLEKFISDGNFIYFLPALRFDIFRPFIYAEFLDLDSHLLAVGIRVFLLSFIVLLLFKLSASNYLFTPTYYF